MATRKDGITTVQKLEGLQIGSSNMIGLTT